jgi:succinate dehydrogenase / fumarate reductase cytochrome b subunit
MNLAGRLFGSSIGRKILMAVTGVIMIGYVVGHLVGNLQIFAAADHINGYAAFLHQVPPLLWSVRLILLASVLIHIWAATVLTLENHAARDIKYGVKHTIRATLSSRLMRWTGVVVLAFLIYHLAQFTLGYLPSPNFKDNLPRYTMTSDYRVAGFLAVGTGTEVLDVHDMVIRTFQNPWISLFYIVAVGLLSYHLAHGAESMFQTIGWRSAKWSGPLHKAVLVLCTLYFLGNLAIPAAVLLGKLQVHEPARIAAGK